MSLWVREEVVSEDCIRFWDCTSREGPVNIHCGVIWLNFPHCLDRNQLFVSELWRNNREKEKVAHFVSNERKCKFRSRMYAAKPVLCWIVILCCWLETLGIVDLNLCHCSVCFISFFYYCIAGFLTHTLLSWIRIHKLWRYQESTDASITACSLLRSSSQT